jgi:hypothetical protein
VGPDGILVGPSKILMLSASLSTHSMRSCNIAFFFASQEIYPLQRWLHPALMCDHPGPISHSHCTNVSHICFSILQLLWTSLQVCNVIGYLLKDIAQCVQRSLMLCVVPCPSGLLPQLQRALGGTGPPGADKQQLSRPPVALQPYRHNLTHTHSL